MYLNVKRALRLLALLGCLVAIVAVPAAFAQEEDNTTASEASDTELLAAKTEEAELWFVELKSKPRADGTSPSTIKQEQEDFRRKARQAGIEYKERKAFDTLFNGFSLEVDGSRVGAIRQLEGVKAVYPVATVPLPETSSADPDLASALDMTGASTAQNALDPKLTGKGIKVAVMDSGVDYDHPDLGGCFGPECRVETGYDFVGDAFNDDSTSPSFNPVPAPDPDPDDCDGHGTHVAGIVGANGDFNEGEAKGVAPGVALGAYRVFGCEGSTTADIMLEAMERVLADDMDVLNMSIGAAFNSWPQYPTAQASDRLVNKGVSVIASIGNSGASGLYAAGAPGVGEKVIGVASFDNSHVDLPTFTISPDNKAIGYTQASAAPNAPTSGTDSMARTGKTTSTNDACDALPAGSLTGKVVLIRRGTCSFHIKALNAQNAGAKGVVFYNNAPGRISPTVQGPQGAPAITIPVVAISDIDGVLIDSRIAAGDVTMTWTNETASFKNDPNGGLISGFSSYGLAADLGLKPDIGAPGGLIRSTYPLEAGGYATISGTSMASPHVAGGVALLLESKPNTPAQAVRDILQTSADPKPWSGNPGLGLLDNVHRQGAGMLDIDDAILSKTQIKPGKLSLGESEAGPATRTLTIKNTGSSAVTYDLSHAPALSTGSNTFAPQFLTGFASVAFSFNGAPATSVTVPAGGQATVDVTITANPMLPVKSQYGGYVVLTPQEESGEQTYRVPYAGFKGDYQSIQALTPTTYKFPWLAKQNGSSFANQPNGATYTLTNGDVPYVLVHLDHQVRRLKMEVFDAVSGKSLHKALDAEYVPRNSTPTGAFALPWDGVTENGSKTQPVSDGQYVIRLSVQKALGDDTNPAHSETWTSPNITIDRP